MISRGAARSAIRRLMPDPQRVTLRIRKASDNLGFTDYTVTAQRTEVATREDQGEAITTPNDECRWSLRQESLDAVGATLPVPGDEIVDEDDVTWIIQDSSSRLFKQYHTFRCIKGR